MSNPPISAESPASPPFLHQRATPYGAYDIDTLTAPITAERQGIAAIT
jgi:hypothetical protein